MKIANSKVIKIKPKETPPPLSSKSNKKSLQNLKSMCQKKAREIEAITPKRLNENISTPKVHTEPMDPHQISSDCSMSSINKEKAKKHTWIYDELFIKKKIVDMSFEEEGGERNGDDSLQNNNPQQQMSLNKYNTLQNEIDELRREIIRLNNIINNASAEENGDIEKQLNQDIRNYKDVIEHCLRESANLTKEILEMKKKIKEIKMVN